MAASCRRLLVFALPVRLDVWRQELLEAAISAVQHAVPARLFEQRARSAGVPITTGSVGILGCDYIDVRGAWTRSREISPDGAVLVRPDRYIAFRSITAVDDPVRTLRRALSTVLSTAQV